MNDFWRSFPLIDIALRSAAQGGDGRTVEAYAAVFNAPTDIADQHGRYREQIAPTAFNRTIAQRGSFPVMFNHGRTIFGTPSDKWSAPVGVTTEMRTDARGLVSVWRADPTANGDEVLAMIDSGSIRGQSFSGRFLQSTPATPRGGFGPDRKTGELTLVTRTEIALNEIGPGVFPYYDGAVITGRRAEELAPQITGLDPDERAELARLIAGATPLGDPAPDGTSDVERAAEDSPDGHSGRQYTPDEIRTLIRAEIAMRSNRP